MSKYTRSAEANGAKWAAISCLLAAMAMPAAGADKIALGLHLKTGQILNLLTTTESNLTQTIMGQEMNAVSTTGMGYKFEVQQVADDGTAACKVTYSTVQMKSSVGGFGMEYDSTKPAASVSPMVKPFAVLVGQSFSLRVSPTGRVTDVQGVEAIYERMLKDIELPDESMRGTMEQQIREQFGAEGIRETLEQAIGMHFPEGAVDIGDSWVKRAAVSHPYPMSLESTYALKDRKNGVAIIDVVSKMGSNAAGKPMPVGPMMMTYEFSGERKGQLEIEEASGWTVGARYTQQISGMIRAEGGPQGTMSFPFSGTITIRIESKK